MVDPVHRAEGGHMARIRSIRERARCGALVVLVVTAAVAAAVPARGATAPPASSATCPPVLAARPRPAAYADTSWPTEHADVWRTHAAATGLPSGVERLRLRTKSVALPDEPVWGYVGTGDE